MPKKVRIKDIAKKVGCSPATVSQAFHNPKLVNRQTRMAILSTCEELGYVRRKKTEHLKKIIGVLGSSHDLILGEYYNSVTSAIISTAKKEGINVIIEEFTDQEETLPSMFTKKVLDGVIILGKISQDHVLMIKQNDYPLVLCGHPIPGLELNTVLSDGRAGIYAVAKHLIGLGHRKIAYITGGPVFDPVTSDRLDGYRYALNEAGIELEESYTVVADFCVWESAVKAVDKLITLKNRPTATICESDALAYMACQRLQEKGLRIPEDISVTGFDGLPFPPYVKAVMPKLTTIKVNLQQLGETAVRVLLDQIENRVNVAYRHTLPVELIAGETAAAPTR